MHGGFADGGATRVNVRRGRESEKWILGKFAISNIIERATEARDADRQEFDEGCFVDMVSSFELEFFLQRCMDGDAGTGRCGRPFCTFKYLRRDAGLPQISA
ncbi:hypothetical protein D3C86_1877840 [compost metagenome]